MAHGVPGRDCESLKHTTYNTLGKSGRPITGQRLNLKTQAVPQEDITSALANA
jgi:hypothetical protein